MSSLSLVARQLTFPGHGGYRPSFPLEKTQRVSTGLGKAWSTSFNPLTVQVIFPKSPLAPSSARAKKKKAGKQESLDLLDSTDGPAGPNPSELEMHNVHKSAQGVCILLATRDYNQTTQSHLSRASPRWGLGAGAAGAVNSDFPPVWLSSPRDQSVWPNANGSLPLGQGTSYAAREAVATVSLGSGGCLDTEAGPGHCQA